MGHLVFVVLHVIALLFGALALVITIPAHLIYAAIGSSSARGAAPALDAPSPKTHVRCPSCRELVRMDATKCKHCGTALLPLAMPVPVADKGRAVAIGVAIVFALFIAYAATKR